MDWTKYGIGKGQAGVDFQPGGQCGFGVGQRMSLPHFRAFWGLEGSSVVTPEDNNGTVIRPGEAPEGGASGLDPLSQEAATT